MRSMRFILKRLGNYRYLALALLFMVGEGLAQVFGAVSLGKVADAITGGGRDALFPSAGLVLGAAAALFLCIFFKDSLMGRYLENGVKDLRREIVGRVTGADYIWLKNQPVGELLSRSIGDTEKVAEAVRPVLVMGVSVFGVLLVIVLYMLVQNWVLTLIFLVLIPVFMAVQWCLSGMIKKYHKGYLSTQADLTAIAAESAGMGEIIKSLNAEDWMMGRFHAAAEEQLNMERGEIRVQTLLAPVNVLCAYLPQIVLIVAGGVLVQRGTITLGILLSFVVLGGIVSDIMGDLSEFVTNLRRMEVVANRIADWWEIPQENRTALSGAAGREKIEELAFTGLSYAYSNGKAVLRNAGGRAEKGDCVAISGESGSGKSTLLMLLATLGAPTGGSLSFNGRPVSEWDLAVLRHEIAFVEQQPYFFPGSVRENLECGHARSGGELRRCLECADAWDFVDALPQKWDTRIGEQGTGLSGGQRQRLALARALLKEGSVLLLDESMSALDPHSEEKVLKNLLSQPEGPILFLVTHRSASAGLFPKQWKLERGELREEAR